MNFKQKISFVLVCLSLFLSACSEQKTPEISKPVLEKTTRLFAEAMANRDYVKAYALTSKSYQSKNTLTKMKTEFEQIVPADSGSLKVEPDIVIDAPDPENKNELGSAYITIDFAEDFEAIYLTLAAENEQAVIETIEFGRID